MSNTRTKQEWIEFLRVKMLSNEPIEYFGENVFIVEMHEHIENYDVNNLLPERKTTKFTLSNGNTINFKEHLNHE
jgi:hypothetical protein